MDLAFLVHTSSNIDGQQYQYYKEYMRETIAGADIDGGKVRVGVVIYRHDGSVIFPLDRHMTKSDLSSAIDNLPLMASDNANVVAGIDTVKDKLFSPEGGDRDEAPNGVIVLTDSDSYMNQEDIPRAAHELRDSGAKVVTKGIGLWASDQLPKIASGDDAVLGASDTGELPYTVPDVVAQFQPCKEIA